MELTPDLIAMCKKIAARQARTLPPCFDIADLEQEAMIECWRAMADFDSSLGVPFRAYARPRIRGRILMFCRRKNWLEATSSMFGIEPARNTASDDDDQARAEALVSLGPLVEELSDDELEAIASYYILGESAAEVVEDERAANESAAWEIRTRAIQKMRDRAIQLGMNG